MVRLEAIFEPKKAVVVGSSKIQEIVGMASPKLFQCIIYNMKQFYQGETYILDIGDRKGSDKLKEFPATPELSIIVLPPQESVEQVQRLARTGIKGFIVINGGFRDEHRERLMKIKEEYGARVLGPNTIMGVINTANGLNTTFEKNLMPKKGEIAVISQSGGVGACLLDWACFYRMGISKFAFTGDKIDIDDVDLLQYYADDTDTRVICLYMEGVKDGRKFIEKAKQIVSSKPILILKGGITEKSAKRAKSHTASIAGLDEIFNAALRKAGIIRVQDLEELINAATALSKQPPMRGDCVAIVSNVGGPAILAADAVMKNDLKLATLSESTRKKIERLYPGVDAANPIDIVADAKAERYSKVLDLVLADRNVDGILVINMLKSCFFEPEDAQAIKEVSAKYPNKPLVDVAGGREDFSLVYAVLEETKIPLYDLPEKAVKVLKVLREYGRVMDEH